MNHHLPLFIRFRQFLAVEHHKSFTSIAFSIISTKISGISFRSLIGYPLFKNKLSNRKAHSKWNVASEAVKGNREQEEILKRLTPPLFRQNQPLFVSRMVTIWSQNSLTVAISVTSTGS